MGRIMVVDDEAVITMQLEERLMSMGYEVVESASSGEQAVEMARRLRPEMILMDIVMPGKLDGIDASKRIQAELDIPVIFVTAYANDEFIERAKSVQPIAYILKPFQEKEIKAAIEVGLYRKRVEEELQRSQQELEALCQNLRNLSSHEQYLIEEERAGIARKLYDDLGQTLAALKMDLSWLSAKLLKDRKLLLDRANSMAELIDTSIQAVRRISTELRPKMLDDLGVAATIEWQAEEFQNRTGVKCELTLEPEDIILDQARSTAIFRIFQEALTNVARHTKATRVKVSLKKKAGSVVLQVIDNGIGITEEEISDPKSFGLTQMRERAYYLGGEVKISGIQGKGTTITVSIPLGNRDRNS